MWNLVPDALIGATIGGLAGELIWVRWKNRWRSVAKAPPPPDWFEIIHVRWGKHWRNCICRAVPSPGGKLEYVAVESARVICREPPTHWRPLGIEPLWSSPMESGPWAEGPYRGIMRSRPGRGDAPADVSAEGPEEPEDEADAGEVKPADGCAEVRHAPQTFLQEPGS